MSRLSSASASQSCSVLMSGWLIVCRQATSLHVSRDCVWCILVWLARLKRVCGAFSCAPHSLVHSLGSLCCAYPQDMTSYLQGMTSFVPHVSTGRVKEEVVMAVLVIEMFKA